MKTNYMSLQLS